MPLSLFKDCRTNLKDAKISTDKYSWIRRGAAGGLNILFKLCQFVTKAPRSLAKLYWIHISLMETPCKFANGWLKKLIDYLSYLDKN